MTVIFDQLSHSDDVYEDLSREEENDNFNVNESNLYELDYRDNIPYDAYDKLLSAEVMLPNETSKGYF